MGGLTFIIKAWLPLGIAALLLALPASARQLATERGPSRAGDPGRTVVVFTPDGADGRLPALQEAVTFWNRTFSELGLRPRLAEPAIVVAASISRTLENFARQISLRAGHPDAGAYEPDAPRELLDVGADIVVLLSKQQLMSFAWPVARRTRFFIGIRVDQVPPLSYPNVTRNVIAHELGHALGLAHNRNPRSLMCGPCQPLAFSSEERAIFPLTREDRVRLTELHPPQ